MSPQISSDVAEIKSDVKHILKAIEDLKQTAKENEKRIDSLEASRQWAKATFTTSWAAIVFLGWDWIKELFK